MLRCSLRREVSLGRRLRALKRESEAGHRALGRRVALSAVGVAVGIADGEMRGAVQLEAVEGEQQRQRYASGGSLLATRDRRRTKRPSRRRRRGGGVGGAASSSAVLGGRCPG